jgi:hypothetical protein
MRYSDHVIAAHPQQGLSYGGDRRGPDWASEDGRTGWWYVSMSTGSIRIEIVPGTPLEDPYRFSVRVRHILAGSLEVDALLRSLPGPSAPAASAGELAGALADQLAALNEHARGAIG